MHPDEKEAGTPPASAVEEQKPAEDPLLKEIKDLKENTVDKKEYDRVMEQNRQLLKAVLDGDGDTPSVESKESIEDLRKELFNQNGDLSNLEVAKKSLDLRKKLMAEGKPDPFLPVGTNYIVTNEDIEAANRVAECLEHCVEYADGDSEVFTNELMRLTKDAKPGAKAPFERK